MALQVGEDACCEISVSLADDDHNQPPHDDCRNCNPFQACTCCAPAMMPAPEIQLFSHEILPVAKAQNIVANVHCPEWLGSDFWQPPRAA